MDRSLKSKTRLTRHRNVLTRAERLAALEDDGRWDESTSVFGLPKVAHRKSTAGGKTKKAETPAAAAAEAPAASDQAQQGGTPQKQ